jgi:hypothetical protein
MGGSWIWAQTDQATTPFKSHAILHASCPRRAGCCPPGHETVAARWFPPPGRQLAARSTVCMFATRALPNRPQHACTMTAPANIRFEAMLPTRERQRHLPRRPFATVGSSRSR